MRATLVTLLTLATLAATARADAPRVTGHVEAAFSLLGGDRTISTSFRGYAGGSLALGPAAATRPFLGAGLHLGTGALHVDDPRALDGSVELTYATVGPELRAGVAFVDGGYVDSQLYLAFAPTAVRVDDRLRLDAVDGVVAGRGFRAAVGVTFGDRYYPAVADSIFAAHHGSGSSSGDGMMLVAFLVPVTFEVEMERGAGSDRYGVSFGWGF